MGVVVMGLLLMERHCNEGIAFAATAELVQLVDLVCLVYLVDLVSFV